MPDGNDVQTASTSVWYKYEGGARSYKVTETWQTLSDGTTVHRRREERLPESKGCPGCGSTWNSPGCCL